MIKILVSIPSYNFSVNPLIVNRILKWHSDFYVGFMPIVGIQPVDEARNKMVEEFLKTDCTHLFMIDDDTIPPDNAIERLLNLDLDVVSGLTPIIDGKEGKITKYNAVDVTDKQIAPKTGLHRSRGVGASCLLVKREVFEKIKRPWFRFIYKDDKGNDCFVSEDIYFISLLLQAGITPMVDSEVVCQHFKRVYF